MFQTVCKQFIERLQWIVADGTLEVGTSCLFFVVAFPLSATTGTCSATTETNVLVPAQLISSACSEGRNLTHSGCVSFHDTHTRASTCTHLVLPRPSATSLSPQVLRFSWFLRRLCESPLALRYSSHLNIFRVPLRVLFACLPRVQHGSMGRAGLAVIVATAKIFITNCLDGMFNVQHRLPPNDLPPPPSPSSNFTGHHHRQERQIAIPTRRDDDMSSRELTGPCRGFDIKVARLHATVIDDSTRPGSDLTER